MSKISFFNPVSIHHPNNKTQRFGEWLFNFKRTVYVIRTDVLKSNRGTEVQKKDLFKESCGWNVLRGVLCILVIPAGVGLIDRAVHRSQYPKLHINHLRGDFRNKEFAIVCPDPARDYLDGDQKIEFTFGSVFGIIKQPKPWSSEKDIGPACIAVRNSPDGDYKIVDFGFTESLDDVIDKRINLLGKDEYHFGKQVDDDKQHPDFVIKHPYWSGNIKDVTRATDQDNPKITLAYHSQVDKYFLTYDNSKHSMGITIEIIDQNNVIAIDAGILKRFDSLQNCMGYYILRLKKCCEVDFDKLDIINN